MKICEKLDKKKRLVSFEFFPPKKAENDHILFETLSKLVPYSPDFVSITYGAGGSTKDKTLEWTLRIKREYNIDVMMHLTCITSDKSEIEKLIVTLKDNGIENILALRGDIPQDGLNYNVSQDFKYASDLLEFLKPYQFCIGVAGYPEGHIESKGLDDDIRYLKRKIDAGGDFIITQLFFSNDLFYRYLEILEKNSIQKPVLAGIMPITSFGQIEKFRKMCGVYIPESFVKKIENKDDDYVLQAGVEYAIKQCEDLINHDVKGLHFYTLNRSEATKNILDSIKL